MKGLSKSRHTALCQCPEALRLKVSKPKEAEVDEALQARCTMVYCSHLCSLHRRAAVEEFAQKQIISKCDANTW